MGVKVKGLTSVVSGLSRKAKQKSKLGEAELVRQAKIIAVTARDYAPRKDGHLQSAQAIHTTKPKTSGIRFEVKVVMGDKLVTIGGKTRDIRKYMEIIHGAPSDTNWGPGTIAKGPQAREEYLLRAADDKRESVIKAISNAVKQGYRIR